MRRGYLPLAVLLLAGSAACSGGHGEGPTTMTPPPVTTPQPVTTTPAADHRAELAADTTALTAAFVTPTGVWWSSSGIVTGTDTDSGWQVQAHQDSTTSTVPAGPRRLQLLCAGRGSLDVTIRSTTGDDTQELSRGSAPCSPDAAPTWVSFAVVDGSPTIDVLLVPDADTVAVAGYAVT